jgi:hypothetical protein
VVVGSLLASGITLSNLQEMMDPEYYDDTERGDSKNHSIFLRGICMVVRIRGQDRIQCIGGVPSPRVQVIERERRGE